MKRFTFTNLLLAGMMVLMAGALASCSNDDDLPEVKIDISFSRASEDNGVLYVMKGNDLSIDALTVTPLNNGKKATLGATAYYWNYQYLGSTVVEPFGLTIDTADMPVGEYVLQINTTVFQVDKSVGVAYFTYPVVIVESAADLPEGVNPDEGGTLEPDVKMRSGAAPTA